MSTEDFSESKITQQLRKQQDLSYAIVGGLTAAIVCAIIWAIITVSTEHQIGYMAIGLGFAVGMSVRFFGAGVDPVYQIVGAILALVGCLLGNLFSQVGFIAHAESLGYFETLTYLNAEIIGQIYAESFNPMDLLFYGIAIYEGHRFSIRPATDEIIQEFNSTGKISPQSYNHLRFPFVLTSFIAIGIFAYFLSRGTSGHKVYTYESGAKMSEGDLVHGKEDGEWLYWDENGTIQSKAHFVAGVEEGAWEWYDSASNVIRKGSYKNGLYDGTWINYYSGGIVSDSGNYVQGRMEGPWIYRYENGKVSQTGTFKRDKNQGEWLYYFENGNLSSQGIYENGRPVKQWKSWFENGKPKEETEWVSDSISTIVNTWDENGKQLIINGNGTYVVKYENGKIMQTGEVKKGMRVGKWILYFENGNKQEEGEYIARVYHVHNSWSPEGEVMVSNKTGNHVAYLSNGQSNESGKILDGLRDGEWITLHPVTNDTLQIVTYHHGKFNGQHSTFYENGMLYSNGSFLSNKKEGEWNWYYQSGMLETSVTYKNNKKEGVQTFWSENGKKLKEEHYQNDELISENLVTEDQD